MDLDSIQPDIRWSIQSETPPLPKVLPSLQAVKASLVYKYKTLKRFPSIIEGAAKFSRAAFSADLLLQPTYEVPTGKLNVLVQLSKGTSFVLARFTNTESVLDAIQGSFLFNLRKLKSSVRVTPAFDQVTKDMTCVVEADTGRTKALLNLEYNNPTLAVVHQLDDRNVLSPEIGLYDARITYQWDHQLPNGGSLQTRVDPLSDIKVTWTDQSTAGGCWTTDVRLPLEGTTVQALAADIRVKRKFQF